MGHQKYPRQGLCKVCRISWDIQSSEGKLENDTQQPSAFLWAFTRLFAIIFAFWICFIQDSLLEQLTKIRDKLRIVARRYNLYGTSLCIVVKGDKVAVVLIDFAKAMKVDGSNRPEEIYSAEGLDNIIQILSNPASPAVRTFGQKSYDDIVDLVHDKGWGNDKFEQDYRAGKFKA